MTSYTGLSDVWVLFAIESKGFPNFYPVGVYTSESEVEGDLEKLPKGSYQLFELPVNQFFGTIDNHKKLTSRLGNFYHKHIDVE